MQSTNRKLRAFMQRHAAACILAFFIGAMSVAPQLYATYRSPGYAGVALMGTDAEAHYVARIQEVYNGYPTLGNVFLPDKDIPPLEPALGEDIDAYLGMALHISAVQMDILGKFLFPLLIALLLYGFLYALSRRRSVALLGVFFAMWGDSLMDGVHALLGIFRGIAPTNGFLLYSRPINPEISALFLFGALFLAYQLFLRTREESWRLSRMPVLIVFGVIAGLSLYVSIYDYTFLLVFGGSLLVYRLFQKSYRTVLELGLAGSIALLTAIPFVINYIHAAASPAYAGAALRFGLVTSHAPIMSLWVLVLAIGAFFLPGRERSAKIFFLFSALSLVVVLNQQIMTGHVMQSGHYHWYITKPLVGLMLGWYAVLFVEFVFQRQWLRHASYGLIASVLFYNAVLVQAASYRAAASALSEQQAYAPVLSYLHTQPATNVVWADRQLSLLIPLYTSDDAPNNDYAQYYLVPSSYLVERMLLEYKLRGVLPEQITSILERDRADIAQRLFGIYWRNTAGNYNSFPDALIESYAHAYESIYNEQLVRVFKQFAVTEVVWDTVAEPSWNLGAQPMFHVVAKIGRFNIYRI